MHETAHGRLIQAVLEEDHGPDFRAATPVFAIDKLR
jgi:hypothetical protein